MMNKISIPAIIIMILFAACDTKKDFADPSENYFIKYYGKEGRHWGADFVAIPSDGSFVICGTSLVAISEGSTVTNYGKQIYLARIDSKGQVIWEKNLGGLLDEEAKDIELTSDGNLVMVGNVSLSSTNRDILVMTLTPDGNKIDSVSYGLDLGLDDDAVSVTELNDGFMVCGSKANPPSLAGGDVRDAFQVRFTKSLSLYPNWINSYSQGSLDVAIKAIPVSANSNLIFGYTNGSNANDINNTINYWVYNLNAGGIPQSQNKIGSALDGEILGSVIISPPILGQGYLLSGIAINSSGASNIFLVKHAETPSFNINDIQFERKLEDDLGDVPNNRVFASPAAGNGFILLTNRRAADGNVDMYLTKVDSRGQRLWDSPVIFGGEATDQAAAISELPDGRIIVMGTILVGGLNGQEKIVLLKLNSNGRLSN